MKLIKKKHKGMTLIEVIISIAILSVIVISIGDMVMTSVKINKDSENKQQAIYEAQQALEQLKGTEDFDGKVLDNGLTIAAATGDTHLGEMMDAKGNGMRVVIEPKTDIQLNVTNNNNVQFDAILTITGDDTSSTVNWGSGSGQILNNKLVITNVTKKISIATITALAATTGETDALSSLTDITLPNNNMNILLKFPDGFKVGGLNISVLNQLSGNLNLYIDKSDKSTGIYNIENKQGIIRKYLNYSADTTPVGKIYDIKVQIYKNNEVYYQVNGYKTKS